MSDFRRNEFGLTILETTVVVALIAVVVAFAAPRITSAMRSYRMNIASRELADIINRAKMLAVSENRKTGIALDAAGLRIGLVLYEDDGTVSRIEYRPLPEGVRFERPASTASNPEGVTGSAVVSFGEQDRVYRLDFNSRGMPMNKWGEVESIFIGNGQVYRALTLSSVGGMRAYALENSTWVNLRVDTPTKSKQ